MTGTASQLVVRADPQGFRDLMKAAGEFDKVLTAGLRRNIRDAAKGVMGKVAAEVRTGSYAAETGLREGIAKGLRVQISTTTRQPGVRIVSTGAGLPDNKKRMASVWSGDTFRHPVFGNAVWAQQSGHRYFFPIIYRERGAVTTAVTKAMQAAATAMGAEIR